MTVLGEQQIREQFVRLVAERAWQRWERDMEEAEQLLDAELAKLDPQHLATARRYLSCQP